MLEYVFSPLIEPKLRVKTGETFMVETEDANMGKIRTPNDLPIPKVLGSTVEKIPWEANPVTGPIYVEGAERGDVVSIEILDIIPLDQGYNMFIAIAKKSNKPKLSSIPNKIKSP